MNKKQAKKVAYEIIVALIEQEIDSPTAMTIPDHLHVLNQGAGMADELGISTSDDVLRVREAMQDIADSQLKRWL